MFHQGHLSLNGSLKLCEAWSLILSNQTWTTLTYKWKRILIKALYCEPQYVFFLVSKFEYAHLFLNLSTLAVYLCTDMLLSIAKKPTFRTLFTVLFTTRVSVNNVTVDSNQNWPRSTSHWDLALLDFARLVELNGNQFTSSKTHTVMHTVT